MTLFRTLPQRLLTVVGLSLICALPTAYAAELEGTVVPLNATHADTVAAPAPAVEPAPEASAPAADSQSNSQPAQRHSNWERDWEKNLNQAFGGNRNNDEQDDGPSAMEALIVLFAVIALIIVLCSPLILLGIYLMLRYKAKNRHQQALNTNIDKLLAAGRDIPVELLRGDDPKSDEPVGSRDKGIRNIFLGSGWLVFLTIMVGFDVGSAGLIWIALGVSQVIIWHLNNPTGKERTGQQD